MKKKPKLKNDLIQEVDELQERVKALETINAEHTQSLEKDQISERQFRTFFTDAAVGTGILFV